MGAFRGPDSLYSMPPDPDPSTQSEETRRPAPKEANPPYARYSDTGIDSFAPLPVNDPAFQSSTQLPPAVVGPPTVSIPLIALGLGFLFWVMTRND